MKKRVIIILFLALIGLVSFYFDSQIVKGISLLRNNILDYFFLGITFISAKTIIFSFLTILFLWKKNKRKWVLPLWVTLSISALIVFILKIIANRPRPFQLGIVSLLPILEKANHVVWNFSFPSSHSLLAFCALPLVLKEFPRFKYVWITLAVLVAFSRIYFGLHFLSDVIFGSLIGYLLGMLILNLEKKYKVGEKVYKKLF